MRSAPPLSELPAFPVTGGLALLAVGITTAGAFDLIALDPAVLDVRAFWEEPWRLLTSVLPHLGVFHLAFNVYWVWTFGTDIERTFGHARTLALVVVLAAVSGAAEYAVFDGGVGLSGVGYGLFGFLFVLSRRDSRFFHAVDRSTVNLFGAWFLICIVLTATDVLPVANVAHGAGAIVGMLLGVAVAGPRRALAVVAALVFSAGALTGASVLRPTINLSPGAGSDSAYLGYRALENGDPRGAVEHYERALALGDDPRWWYNLALAHFRLEDAARGLVAIERALTLAPDDEQYQGLHAVLQAMEAGPHRPEGQQAGPRP